VTTKLKKALRVPTVVARSELKRVEGVLTVVRDDEVG